MSIKLITISGNYIIIGVYHSDVILGVKSIETATYIFKNEGWKKIQIISYRQDLGGT